MSGPHYFITSRMHGYVLDINEGNRSPGATVILYPKKTPSPSDNQLWQLEDAGHGYVYIVSKLNGLVLDIEGGKKDAGAKLIMWHRKSGSHEQTANQKWKIMGDVIVSAMHGMVFDVYQGKYDPGTPLIVWPNKQHDNINQQWYFERV